MLSAQNLISRQEDINIYVMERIEKSNVRKDLMKVLRNNLSLIARQK